MPDPSSETSRINYGQRDDASRRLWNTQIGKANPWEHRAPNEEADAEPPSPSAEALGDEPAATTIAQQDRLRLKRPGPAPANPFERLIEHQLNIQLPKE